MDDKTMRYHHLGQFQEKEANNWDTIAIFRWVLLIAHCQHDSILNLADFLIEMHLSKFIVMLLEKIFQMQVFKCTLCVPPCGACLHILYVVRLPPKNEHIKQFTSKKKKRKEKMYFTSYAQACSDTVLN